MTRIQPDNILQCPFWQEKVRVLSVKYLNDNQLKIEAVGIETRTFYNPILSNEDIKLITIIEEKPVQFFGDGESLFLFIESHRIRNAFQFDPLYAVNISQAKPEIINFFPAAFSKLPNPQE